MTHETSTSSIDITVQTQAARDAWGLAYTLYQADPTIERRKAESAAWCDYVDTCLASRRLTLRQQAVR